MKFRFKLFNFFLVGLIVLNLFLAYMLWSMVEGARGYLLEQRTLIILSLGFAVAEVIFLITILVLLHRAFGPFQRMEEILEKVLQGDYSSRIALRKKDIACSFVDKLNKILDLLEEKQKKK